MEMSHRATVRDFGGHLALVVIMKQWCSSPNKQMAACQGNDKDHRQRHHH
jgi:hypothetical protein